MRHIRPFATSITVLSIVGTPVSNLAAQEPIRPPVATMKPRIDTLHGDIRTDNYFWIREKSNPEVIKYLDRIRRDQNIADMESLEKMMVQQGIDPVEFKQNIKNQFFN